MARKKESRFVLCSAPSFIYRVFFVVCFRKKTDKNTRKKKIRFSQKGGYFIMADKFQMTQKGYDEAVKRLEYLQTVKRDEIVERIVEARSHGDLSENAEYDAARNEQAANEGEILEL